ncbi:hypothetical protein, partial [Roseiflexus castenholzii]|uniref:hypothetical protein n=1 Tax=Roseiflexus castenholzii TaxID=120962 RepID=UPI003C797FEA
APIRARVRAIAGGRGRGRRDRVRVVIMLFCIDAVARRAALRRWSGAPEACGMPQARRRRPPLEPARSDAP